uniref:Phosphatidylinositol-3-phosphatase SAC1 n=1 Tax=Anopheles farauti TaxID=69004 RepID=A0A182QZ36_9DIPT
MDKRVYEDLNFFITPDRFYIQPCNANEFVLIDRMTGDFSHHKDGSSKEQLPVGGYELRKIYGVLGMVRLIGGLHLVVVTNRDLVGVIRTEPIWRLSGVDIIALLPSLTHLTEEQKFQHEVYLSMMGQVLNTPCFYFAYGYDLTNSLQRKEHGGSGDGAGDGFNAGLFSRSDKRFVWNGALLGNCPQLHCYLLPIIHGYVAIHDVRMHAQTLTWALISRRSVKYAGTRLFCRGINADGDVANYVETEQLIVTDTDRVSFVQTRGSIPLFWQQTPNLQYKPRPQLLTGRDHLTACSRHFDDQCRRYGLQVLINLIDHKGAEDVLEKAYDATVSTLANPKLTYVSFDFHKECRKMRYDRLSLLIDRIASQQDDFGVFHVGNDGKVYSVQQGVFRTNCIDCLDRTNVVQSLIAKRSLEQSLVKLGLFRAGEKHIDPNSLFESVFKAVWANNADLISTQYSGTGALKTDFTRTGKRTFMGLLRDGFNSMKRYCMNNFTDGRRQDSIELFLGTYRVREGEGLDFPSPLTETDKSVEFRKRSILATVLVKIVMLYLIVLYPSEYDMKTGLMLMAWCMMAGFTYRYVAKHRMDFVDFPKLLPKK